MTTVKNFGSVNCRSTQFRFSVFQGECVEEGTTNFGVNKAGFMLHSAIHAARPDIKCVVHLHTPNIVAVSTG